MLVCRVMLILSSISSHLLLVAMILPFPLFRHSFAPFLGASNTFSRAFDMCDSNEYDGSVQSVSVCSTNSLANRNKFRSILRAFCECGVSVSVRPLCGRFR